LDMKSPANPHARANRFAAMFLAVVSRARRNLSLRVPAPSADTIRRICNVTWKNYVYDAAGSFAYRCLTNVRIAGDDDFLSPRSRHLACDRPTLGARRLRTTRHELAIIFQGHHLVVARGLGGIEKLDHEGVFHPHFAQRKDAIAALAMPRLPARLF